MAVEIDFQPYLRSLSKYYAAWWRLYTLTDAETRTRQQQEPWKTPFDFGLMVQTVAKERSPDGLKCDRQELNEKIERFPVLEGVRGAMVEDRPSAIAQHRQVLLVGRPGSGKSTTLARLVLEEAQNVLLLEERADEPGGLDADREDPPSPALPRRYARKKGEPENESTSELGAEPEIKVPLFKGDLGGSRGLCNPTPLIPVLVELRFWSGSILDRIQAFFQRHDLQLDRAQIEDLLFHQRLFLLIDGLNELPSEAARLDVNKFRQDHPKVSMLFTTRDLSLGGDFGIEKKLEMQPLTEAQMQAFVRSYVPEQAEAMLRHLQGRLRELGQTLLLLWMLCGLFRQTGQIPANLGEVFRAFRI